MLQGKTTFLKLVIVMMGVLALILCIVWLPDLARHTADNNPDFAYMRYPVLIVVYITAIPFYFVLYQAFKLLHLIERKNAFSELAIESLKSIKYCAISIVIVYAAGVAFIGFLTGFQSVLAVIGAVIIFAASAVAVFAAVLQELLAHALEMKTEIDLTV
ncbi:MULTISPECIES: DUF2975 domain-containing protein [unclassified Paenibacillus]|uniref:DUF2975 domain-containing protein n=1 Tax=unclassified Paenibacillus TaxID=185978 RepID=UPI001C0FCAF6|nr:MULTISPECIES: DUF2975 domain-containing protein [unclassified Paenibacillus]MBU5443091.1 DUF2975 domain-containing protein [Paenibacillus sp. MSJ-34]CAH0122264.1 hypothetical protein PAE9249_04812 [Paenibacillus sp. CECT 9249]